MLEAQTQALRRIADLAHCGGLAGLTEAEALALIRRLTLEYWDKTRDTDRMALGALEARRAAKAVHLPIKA